MENGIPVGESGKLNGNAGTERRRSGRVANGQQNGTPNGKAPLPRLLYGDGLLVSMGNTAERTAYANYRQAYNRVPPSKQHCRRFISNKRNGKHGETGAWHTIPTGTAIATSLANGISQNLIQII